MSKFSFGDFMVFKVLPILAIIFFVTMVSITLIDAKIQKEAPCSEMESWSIRYLPVRCYSEFGITK
jgi:hypothetical protein